MTWRKSFAPSQIHDALMIGILAGLATLAAGLVACTLWEKRHGQVGQICHARVR
ncbi:hypothetical protein [Bifidobacterium magnum]|uniref:hypothetical protein n=1 Tax=Bifidobacterium magnum TaxID=1692 RepID=UPI00041B8AE1|nr:hypothetical protein [Bifidobacterium magnum]